MIRKIIFIAIMVIISFSAIGQGVQFQGNFKTTLVNRGWLKSDSGIVSFPVGDTIFPSWLGATYKSGSSVLKSGLPYYYDGSMWKPFGGGSGSSFDTTYIYQALTDTANNIRSDIGDSLALKVYRSDSNVVYSTPTQLATKQPLTNSLSTTSITLDDTQPFYELTGATNNKVAFKTIGKLLTTDLQVKAGFQYHNDFINPVTTTTSDGAGVILVANGSGATCTTVSTPATNRVGIAQTTTGTTSTGRVAIATANAPVRLSGGAWLYTADVKVVQLSTSTERFALLIGFLGNYTTVNQTNAVYFLYDQSGVSTSSSASANWQCATVSNSSRTITNTTGVAVSAGTFVRLQILVNSDGTSVGFYINGTLVKTETNTIPTAANREVGFGALTVKSAHVSVPALVQYDFININCEFTTER
jgi:hypothetical protein